jgi:hypothetical protein
MLEPKVMRRTLITTSQVVEGIILISPERPNQTSWNFVLWHTYIGSSLWYLLWETCVITLAEELRKIGWAYEITVLPARVCVSFKLSSQFTDSGSSNRVRFNLIAYNKWEGRMNLWSGKGNSDTWETDVTSYMAIQALWFILYTKLNVGWRMNDELYTIWKESAVA